MSKGKQDSPTNEPSNPTHKLLPARVHDTLPGKLLLLPVRMRPFFPAQTMPIVLPEALWRETVGGQHTSATGWAHFGAAERQRGTHDG